MYTFSNLFHISESETRASLFLFIMLDSFFSLFRVLDFLCCVVLSMHLCIHFLCVMEFDIVVQISTKMMFSFV